MLTRNYIQAGQSWGKDRELVMKINYWQHYLSLLFRSTVSITYYYQNDLET